MDVRLVGAGPASLVGAQHTTRPDVLPAAIAFAFRTHLPP